MPTENDFIQIEQELQPLRNEKGLLSTEKYKSWLQMRGAIHIVNHIGVPTVVIAKKYQGTKLLFEVLNNQFDLYSKWRKNGKKIQDIGNFNLEHANTSTQQTHQRNEEERTNVYRDFSEDVPFGGTN